MLKMQIKTMLGSKGFKAAFAISMVASFVFFIMTFKMRYGEANWISYYCGMGGTSNWSIYSFLLCFLLVLPFAISYEDEIQKNIYGTIIIRTDKKRYFKTKILATFLGNFVVVVVPLLVNMFLCFLFLPHVEHTIWGEPGTNSFLALLNGKGVDYSIYHREQPLVELANSNLILYCLLYLMLLGGFCGLIGVVLLALSFWIPQYKIILFLPFLVISQIGKNWTGNALNQAMEDKDYIFLNLSMWDYVSPLSFRGKVYPIFWGFIVILCIFVLISYLYVTRKDYVHIKG